MTTDSVPCRLDARRDGPCPVRVFVDGVETDRCVWYDLDAQTAGLIGPDGLRRISGAIAVRWQD